MTDDNDVMRLVYGVTDLATTTDCLRVLWTIAFGEGRESMRPELEAAQEANRYGVEMARRTPHPVPAAPAELWRIRGDHARADRIEAEQRAWFDGAA